MDERRDGGMQSGWPGEWPRPEESSAGTARPRPVPGPPAGAPGDGGSGGSSSSGSPASPRQATEWPDASQQPAAEVVQGGARRTPTGVAAAVGLVLAGALAGGIGIAAVQHGQGSAATVAASQGLGGPQGQPGQGQLGPGQQGFPGGSFGGGFGGRDDGEQRFVGTVTNVSGSSLTVQTRSGSATYQVGSDTEVVKDGRPATLSDLAAGDQVLVHVITGGSTPTVERIIAGQLPQQPGFGPPGGDRDGDGGPGAQQGTTGGPTSGTTTGVRT